MNPCYFSFLGEDKIGQSLLVSLYSCYLFHLFMPFPFLFADELLCADIAFNAFEFVFCNGSIPNSYVTLLFTQGYYSCCTPFVHLYARGLSCLIGVLTSTPFRRTLILLQGSIPSEFDMLIWLFAWCNKALKFIHTKLSPGFLFLLSPFFLPNSSGAL